MMIQASQVTNGSLLLGEPHFADGGHPQGEGRSEGDRRLDDQQVRDQAVQDHRARQSREARLGSFCFNQFEWHSKSPWTAGPMEGPFDVLDCRD